MPIITFITSIYKQSCSKHREVHTSLVWCKRKDDLLRLAGLDFALGWVRAEVSHPAELVGDGHDSRLILQSTQLVNVFANRTLAKVKLSLWTDTEGGW